MSLLRLLPLLLGFAVAGYGTPAPASPGPRNLFVELLGKTDTAVAAKVDAAWRQLFYGDNDTQRVYYPVGADMAYIADIGNEDARTEGMSYGMMIAVQLDHRDEFNRLWLRYAPGHPSDY